MLKNALRLLRIDHWIKNLFLLIPAFFGGGLFDSVTFTNGVLGFFAFSLVASAVYVFNDLADREQDRNHPDKMNRPIASGVISVKTGVFLAFTCLFLGLGLAFWSHRVFFYITSAYFVLNLAYSLRLKHIAIVDIALISIGFLFRIFAGGAITATPVSQWLIVMTFLLALILGLAKRRGEYLVAEESANFRKALEGYNLPFLDAGIVVCSSVAIVAYLMYSFSPEVTARLGSENVYFTAFFVVVGILRYLQLTLVYGKTESPTRALFTDIFLQLVLLAWLSVFFYFIYA